MEIFTAGVTIIQTIVTLIGGGMVVIGIIQFLQGQSDSNAAQKQTGVGLFIAGGGIALVAQTLIPMLANLG